MLKKDINDKKHKFVTLFMSHLILLTSVTVANATPTTPTSVPIVLKLLGKMIDIFRAAGIILLVYAVIAFILALKNEDAESKVNAIMQMSISIVLITLSSIISPLLSSAGVEGSIT